MEKMDIKKKLLEGLMGNMDDMASKKLRKGGKNPEMMVEAEIKPLDKDRMKAEKIYDAMGGDEIRELKVDKILNILKGE